jgi:HK97 family phage portal protein
MGLFAHLAPTALPARMRASSNEYNQAFFSGADLPPDWVGSLTAAGVRVSPELAMTLSAVYCAVSTIAYDLATLPVQIFARHQGDNGDDVVRPYYGAGIDSSNGIRSLAYMLMYQPNAFQTASEFWLSMIPQFLLREEAYAEMVYAPSGAMVQLVPRHPDRVKVDRLPSGRMQYRLTERTGEPRYLTQDEMFVIRGLSLSAGLEGASRATFGANPMGTALAAGRAAGRFFKSGMTASVIATYAGGLMEDEQEKALHQSLTRYAAGADNAFGLLLVPDDVKVANLSVEPDKAQMMAAQEWGVLDVARLFRIDPSKLMIKGPSQTGSANEQDEIKHVSNCLRPNAHVIEQAIQRDLIVVKDTYFAEFLLEEKLRGDTAARAEYFSKALEGPWMWPSEIRQRENMNPDRALDELAKVRYRPGTPKGSPTSGAAPAPPSGRAALKGMLAVHDNAVRAIRRERVAIEKLAKKHASDVPGWQASLREFEAEHAGFIATTMRLPIEVARAYAAQHGSRLEAHGIVIFDEHWERAEADDLAALALDPEAAAAA